MQFLLKEIIEMAFVYISDIGLQDPLIYANPQSLGKKYDVLAKCSKDTLQYNAGNTLQSRK